MEMQEMIDKALEFYRENDEAFAHDIEALDDWEGGKILDDSRYYCVSQIDEMYGDLKISEFLDRLTKFDSSHDFFKEDIWGISTYEYKDYEDFLEDSYIEELYEWRGRIELAPEVKEIFEEYAASED